ncbi:hypothetical protein BH09VER1_BH09VER1_47120 [soil metagenome]
MNSNLRVRATVPLHPYEWASQATLQASASGVRRFKIDFFGVSAHWGLYSLDGSKEWLQRLELIPREQYARRAAEFDARNFDATRWIDTFCGAGATAFMITTKHHDGFCLWDSKLTGFTSVHSAARRDLLAEIATACHRRGVALHFYFSLLDWHHPDGGGVEITPPRDWDAFCSFMLGQVEELCLHYGPIAGFLFDGWWPAAKAAEDQTNIDANIVWPLTTLYNLVHRLQPQAMITNNHHVLPLPGEDYQVWEIDIPGEDTQGFNCRDIGTKPLMAWMTSTGGWSWQPQRDDLRTPAQLLADFRRCRAKNATYFQNVGPLGTGALNPEEIKLLRQFARLRKS